MTGIFKKLAPPGKWRVPVILISGILAGLFFYLGHISRVASYLSEDPSTCMNCHIMAPQYATWSHSAHREKTNCNDCHVPHNNLLNKYFFKAKDGIRHATVFTLRKEPQVIFIKEEAQAFIGMDAAVLKAEKQLFLESVVPGWDSLAAIRESNYPVKNLFE